MNAGRRESPRKGTRNQNVKIHDARIQHSRMSRKKNISTWNWLDPLEPTRIVKGKREGGKDEEDLSLVATAMEI